MTHPLAIEAAIAVARQYGSVAGAPTYAADSELIDRTCRLTETEGLLAECRTVLGDANRTIRECIPDNTVVPVPGICRTIDALLARLDKRTTDAHP